eukprot:10033519-Karenia_brevis.AAC.1
MGPKGHLHDCSGEVGGGRCLVRCGRKLFNPIMGAGIQDARDTCRPWSPRCFSRLPPSIQEVWDS